MRALLAAALAVAGCGRVGFDERLAFDAPRSADASKRTDAEVDAPVRDFAFVQAEGVAGANETQNIAFDQPVTAGDTLIAAFDYDAPSGVVPTLFDSQGNTFAIAVPNDGETGYYQELAYAVAGADGRDAVTLSLDGSATGSVELRLVEYSGIATRDAIDVTSVAHGTTSTNGNLIVGAPLTTTGADEFLVCFAVGHPSANLSAGTGFTLDSSFDGDVVEHRVGEAATSYTPSAMLAPGGTWTMFFAAFR